MSVMTLNNVVDVQLLTNARLFVTPWLQHARHPCPSPYPGVCTNACPLSWWCHPTISFSVIPFSFCLQYFPALDSFLVSLLFASGSQNTGAAALASVFPMNIQGWLALGLTGLISLLSMWLSRAFSSNTVQNHQFFGAQHVLLSCTHIHTWLQEKP